MIVSNDCTITSNGNYHITKCLICGSDTLCTFYESFRVCDKCTAAVMYIRNKMEKENNED